MDLSCLAFPAKVQHGEERATSNEHKTSSQSNHKANDHGSVACSFSRAPAVHGAGAGGNGDGQDGVASAGDCKCLREADEQPQLYACFGILFLNMYILVIVEKYSVCVSCITYV